jgi:hypothetical protein
MAKKVMAGQTRKKSKNPALIQAFARTVREMVV